MSQITFSKGGFSNFKTSQKVCETYEREHSGAIPYFWAVK